MGRHRNPHPNSTEYRQKRTLRILNVHTGCSYAKITAPEQIRPNEEAAFHIVLNPETLPADETTATATIFTDDPNTPSVNLTIVAAAKRFATLNPDACDFGNIRPETTHQKELTLSLNAPLDASRIRLLPSNQPELTWQMTPDPDTDTSRLITVQLRSPRDSGRFASLLTIAFPNERTLTLPVYGFHPKRLSNPLSEHHRTYRNHLLTADGEMAAGKKWLSAVGYRLLAISKEGFRLIKSLYLMETEMAYSPMLMADG